MQVGAVDFVSQVCRICWMCLYVPVYIFVCVYMYTSREKETDRQTE